MSAFLNALGKDNTLTANGAISNSTSGDLLLNYFAKAGSYRNRTAEEIAADMGSIFGQDALAAMKMVFYNRMISRKPQGLETVQSGQGQRDEFIKSIKWIAFNRPEILEKNVHLIPTVGRWSDLWYDSAQSGYYYYVDTDLVYPLIAAGLQDPDESQLIAKYLPKIRSTSNTKNDRHRRLNKWARGLCAYLKITEREYRKIKSNPENSAVEWQRLACKNQWKNINFNTIPGKALTKLVSGASLKKHGIEKQYVNWIKSKPVAKFTGYAYELYQQAKSRKNLAEKYTYDAQFEGLLEQAKNTISPELLERKVLCALDTSGSMGSMGYYNGENHAGEPKPIDVCVGLGIYFSSLIEGHFKDNVIMFSDGGWSHQGTRFKKLSGSFCDKCDQIKNEAIAWGGTDFQSIIDEIVRVRTSNPNIPVSDFPEVLLVVSDMQFNPTGTNDSNYKAAMKKLRAVGLPDMTIIWWNVNARAGNDFASTIDDKGTVLISGWDGQIVTKLFGMPEKVNPETGEKVKPSPLESMYNCLDQELLNLVKV